MTGILKATAGTLSVAAPAVDYATAAQGFKADNALPAQHASVYSATPPASPINGQLWIDSETSIISVYSAGDAVWIEVSGAIYAAS
jgi:hypothetical protein